MTTEKRDVIFVYNTGKNKQFIQEIAKKRNLPISSVVNFIIDNFRKNKSLQDSLQTHIPVFVKKAKAWQEKKTKKVKS